MHVLSKTELRQDWLRGQVSWVPIVQPGGKQVRQSCYTSVCSANDMMRFASFQTGRRALAILGCIALLYFAGGGAFVHQHSGGPDTACHVCQSLHVPALAAASLNLIPEAGQITAQADFPDNIAPLDSFALHRASRAPPTA